MIRMILSALFLMVTQVSAQNIFMTGPGQPFSGPEFLYYAVTSSTNITGVGTSYYTPTTSYFEVLPNSTIVLAFTIAQGRTISSVGDTLGLTYSSVCTATGGAGNYTTYLYVASVGSSPSSTNDAITINWGTTAVVPIQYNVAVFANLATSSVTNGSSCTGNITPTSGGVIDPGSFTPTTNNNSNGGNVIWAYTAICSGTGTATRPTAYSFPTGFSPINGELTWEGNGSGVNFPDASDWYYQPLQASVDPTFTLTGENASGDCFNAVAVALKINNNSSVPASTIHVASVTHASNVTTAGGTGNAVFWPTVGNLRVITMGWEGGSPNAGTTTVSTVTSSDTCGGSSSFTKVGPNNGSSVIFYEQNCNANPNLTVTIHYTGGGTISQSTWKEYDVINAKTSSYQNFVGNSGTCPTGTNTDLPTITPTGASSGLTIAENGYGTGPVTGVTSPTTALDTVLYADGSDADMSDNADGSGHYYYSSTAAQNWDWSQTVGTSTCYWIAAAFN